MLNVFHRRGKVINHFWGSELLYVPPVPGPEYRHNDALDSLWNLLDLTPAGRGDFHPRLSYSLITRRTRDMTRTPTPKQPKPTAAHRRLDVFIGDWHAKGTSCGMGRMPPTRVRQANIERSGPDGPRSRPSRFEERFRVLRCRPLQYPCRVVQHVLVIPLKSPTIAAVAATVCGLDNVRHRTDKPSASPYPCSSGIPMPS